MALSYTQGDLYADRGEFDRLREWQANLRLMDISTLEDCFRRPWRFLFPISREGFLTASFEKSHEKIAQVDWLTSDSQRRGYKTSGTASVSSESLFIRRSQRLMNASGALGDFLRSLRFPDKIAQCVTPFKVDSLITSHKRTLFYPPPISRLKEAFLIYSAFSLVSVTCFSPALSFTSQLRIKVMIVSY